MDYDHPQYIFIKQQGFSTHCSLLSQYCLVKTWVFWVNHLKYTHHITINIPLLVLFRCLKARRFLSPGCSNPVPAKRGVRRCSAMMEKVGNAQMNCDYEDLIPEMR